MQPQRYCPFTCAHDDEIIQIPIGKKFLASLIANMEKLLINVIDMDEEEEERPPIDSFDIMEIETQIDNLKFRMETYFGDKIQMVDAISQTSVEDESKSTNDFERYADDDFEIGSGRGLTLADLDCDPVPECECECEPVDNSWLSGGAELDLNGKYIRAVDMEHIRRSRANESDDEYSEDDLYESHPLVRSYACNELNTYLLRWNTLYKRCKNDSLGVMYRPLSFFELEEYKKKHK